MSSHLNQLLKDLDTVEGWGREVEKTARFERGREVEPPRVVRQYFVPCTRKDENGKTFKLDSFETVATRLLCNLAPLLREIVKNGFEKSSRTGKRPAATLSGGDTHQD